MPTRITLNIQNFEGSGSQTLLVQDSYDSVIDHIAPLNQPSSALEGRSLCEYTDIHGDRIFVAPQHISWVQEKVDE